MRYTLFVETQKNRNRNTENVRKPDLFRHHMKNCTGKYRYLEQGLSQILCLCQSLPPVTTVSAIYMI